MPEGADGMSAGTGRRALRALLFAGWSLLVTAALLEVGVRLFAPQPLPQADVEIYEPAPGIGWRRHANVRTRASVGEHGVEICTDAAGDRVDCEAPPRDAASCAQRVLVLGDSFVEALAVPFRDTAWSRIERDTGACAAVAGVGGYWPQQYARQLEDRLAEGARFDLVILNFYAGNDRVILGRHHAGSPGGGQAAAPLAAGGPLRAGTCGTGSIRSTSGWRRARTSTWRAASPCCGSSASTTCATTACRRRCPLGALGGPARRDHARVVERIARDAQAAGIPLLVNVIPLQNQVLDPKGESLASRFPALREDLDMDLVSLRFVPRVSALAGVDRVVDLLPWLRAHADESAWDPRDRQLSPRGAMPSGSRRCASRSKSC